MSRVQHVFLGGGSQGIGLACVQKFLRSGSNVTAISRTIDDAAGTNHYLPIRADATDRDSLWQAIRTSRTKFGPLDAVVHCIGEIGPELPIQELSWDRWKKTIDLCLGSAIHIMEATFEDITDRSGSYVFVSSVASTNPYPGIADYNSAKAALSCFVKSLASEIASSGARANSVSPAVVDTPLFRKSPFTEEEASSWHKLGRIGQPEEIAQMCHYLASPETAGWITGQDFVVDGGMTI